MTKTELQAAKAQAAATILSGMYASGMIGHEYNKVNDIQAAQHAMDIVETEYFNGVEPDDEQTICVYSNPPRDVFTENGDNPL